MPTKTFTIYFIEGSRIVIHGSDLKDALKKAGFKNLDHIVSMMSFYIDGIDRNFVYSREANGWIRRVDPQEID